MVNEPCIDIGPVARFCLPAYGAVLNSKTTLCVVKLFAQGCKEEGGKYHQRDGESEGRMMALNKAGYASQ